MSEKVLAYDLGGTKAIVAAVDRGGNLHDRRRELVPKEGGPDKVVQFLADLGLEVLKKHPDIKKAAMASAGPLHPAKGLLLDPTNLTTDGEGWGEIPITQLLSEKLSIALKLENDAAAAVMACHWLGPGKGEDNLMTLTLGTGLGVGAITNGSLERSGRHLHPEGGHIVLRAGDQTAPCGCGNYGCAEAFLSGMNFTKRYATQNNIDRLHGEDMMKMALAGEPKVLRAFEEYAEIMAQAIATYAVLYAPKTIVFAGGFSSSAPIWLERTESRIEEILERRRVGEDLVPKLVVAENHDDMVLLGAAAVAFQRCSN